MNDANERVLSSIPLYEPGIGDRILEFLHARRATLAALIVFVLVGMFARFVWSIEAIHRWQDAGLFWPGNVCHAWGVIWLVSGTLALSGFVLECIGRSRRSFRPVSMRDSPSRTHLVAKSAMLLGHAIYLCPFQAILAGLVAAYPISALIVIPVLLVFWGLDWHSAMDIVKSCASRRLRSPAIVAHDYEPWPWPALAGDGTGSRRAE